MSHFLAAAAAATASAAATILFLGLLMTRPEQLGRSSGQSQVTGVVAAPRWWGGSYSTSQDFAVTLFVLI